MRRGILGLLFFSSWVSAAVVASAQEDEFSQAPKKVVKTDREWAKRLTRNQFLVTRMKATEPPFSGKLLNNHAKGLYTCVCCDSELFSSQTKLTSGTGWPSFWRPYSARGITTEMDYSSGEPRVEVNCSTCGAHLGHVFSDGPPPTGLRYCINSLSLKFVKAGSPAPTSAKAKSEPDASPGAGPAEKTSKNEGEKAGSASDSSAKTKGR